jgi:pyridoxal phosphate enzyme (YggS family)
MIQSNYQRIRNEIAAAANGRPVKLIGASKTMAPEKIRQAYDSGLRCFGENRIQEAVAKIPVLPSDIEWHFIGHLQRNKVQEAVRFFSWIQSVDSQRLLNAIEKEAAKQQKRMLLLLEVNVANEQTKHGLLPEALKELLHTKLEWTEIRGLMAIPPFYEDPELVRPHFQTLRELAASDPGLKELSMGMSHDYKVAIEEGATMVRIGTALFGKRKIL